ncbi:MAG: hypothetical protein KBD53_11430 [Candidatus Omnitrophica bacterium]|nr:hypothetical protein [Candidatus Omnitrophota bacterium]
MNKTMFLLLAFTIFIVGRSEARSVFNDYTSHYHSKANHESHKILHGYYPYFFSDQARSRYSYSPEEKGVYIAGYTDKPWPFPRRGARLEAFTTWDTSRVLFAGISEEHRRGMDEELEFLREKSRKKKVVAQVNDSRQLEKMIEERHWTIKTLD